LSIIQIKDSTENAQSIIKKVKMKFEIAPPMNPSSVLLGLKLISFVLPKLLPAKKANMSLRITENKTNKPQAAPK